MIFGLLGRWDSSRPVPRGPARKVFLQQTLSFAASTVGVSSGMFLPRYKKWPCWLALWPRDIRQGGWTTFWSDNGDFRCRRNRNSTTCPVPALTMVPRFQRLKHKWSLNNRTLPSSCSHLWTNLYIPFILWSFYLFIYLFIFKKVNLDSSSEGSWDTLAIHHKIIQHSAHLLQYTLWLHY